MNAAMGKKTMGVFLVALLLFSLAMPYKVFATQEVSREEEMIRKTMQGACITSVAAVSVHDGEASFSSYGKYDVEETSLFCIGSMSKSFTAFAVMLLQENDRLSIEDPITQYIPWFEATYQGQDVADSITIADLLYQTSGFTNSESQYPNATEGMSLEDNAVNLSGRELAFAPSSQFSYANANYNLLGYIIEQVTGFPYADFMEVEVFGPLGLANTFASLDAGETVIPGTRRAFGRAWEYTLPVSAGAVPAGYLFSCAKDLDRWMQIHLGLVEIPSPYAKVARNTHAINEKSVVDERTHYAAGWFVDDMDGRLYHSGGTANYSCRLVIDPQNGNAACVLTNMNASANTNDMADNLILLLRGDIEMAYSQDIWTVMDTVFFAVTIAYLMLFVLALVLAAWARRKKKCPGRGWYVVPIVLLVLSIVCLFVFPVIFGSPWSVIWVWGPPSIMVGIFCCATLAILVFMLLWMARRKAKRND